ncbi:MAG TPA: IPT/TIG domain-containing protein [Flavisolibacter sp.]|nr:IPT/TIG domain-containing protein [Flavisolibacter sp.]
MRRILHLTLLFILAVGCRPDHPKPVNQSPVIYTFYPSFGTIGSEVTITGKNFSPDKTKNTVKFNGITANIITSSDTELKVTVPNATKDGPISITVGSNTATSTTNFTVVTNSGNQITLTDLSPLTGPVGTEVTITGTNFGNDPVVIISGVEALIVSKSSTSIKFKIPENLNGSDHVVSVTANGQTKNADKIFKLTEVSDFHWSDQLSNTQLDKVYSNGTAFVYNNKIYLGLGTDISASPVKLNNSFWNYDAAASQWFQTIQISADFPLRNNTLSIVFNNKVYVGLGNAMNDWCVLDNPGDNNSWRQLTSFPLTTNNDQAFAFVVANNLYVAGVKGSTTGRQPTIIYKFHPEYNNGAGSWEEIIQMNYSIYRSATIVIGDDAYFGGDLDLNSNSRPYYRFSPNNNNDIILLTSVPGSYQVGRNNAFTLNNKGYILADNKVYEFTPTPSGATWRTALIDNGAHEIKYGLEVNNRAFGIDIFGRIYEFKK